MMTNQLRYSIGVSLALLSPFATAAYTTPAGMWDLYTRATFSVKFPDNKSKSAPNVPGYKFIQFKDDGAYTTIPWQTKPGQWTQQKGKKKYQVSFDPAGINSAHAPPFLNEVISQFLTLAKTKYGKNVSLTSYDQIKLVSLTDSGTLINGGLRISGSDKMLVDITYTDPTNEKSVVAHIKMNLKYLGLRASAPSSCCTSSDAAKNKTDSESFLKDNGKLPGIKTTKTGLQYQILNKGTGKKPQSDSTVTVLYRGLLPNGQQFDSNFSSGSGTAFKLSDLLAGVEGFAEGAQLMQKGSYFRFYIPPDLGYEETGAGPLIKPNSALIFDVQLLDFK